MTFSGKHDRSGATHVIADGHHYHTAQSSARGSIKQKDNNDFNGEVSEQGHVYH